MVMCKTLCFVKGSIRGNQTSYKKIRKNKAEVTLKVGDAFVGQASLVR